MMIVASITITIKINNGHKRFNILIQFEHLVANHKLLNLITEKAACQLLFCRTLRILYSLLYLSSRRIHVYIDLSCHRIETVVGVFKPFDDIFHCIW